MLLVPIVMRTTKDYCSIYICYEKYFTMFPSLTIQYSKKFVDVINIIIEMEA